MNGGPFPAAGIRPVRDLRAAAANDDAPEHADPARDAAWLRIGAAAGFVLVLALALAR